VKPEPFDRTVKTSGAQAQAQFAISDVDAVYIIRILRSTLYTNKPLAVMREYAANAWDEHKDAGCPEEPILVTLPTRLDPTFRVRDYGRGLSWEDIDLIFTKYGASTKRDSNRGVGQMGIGCKSAFAYSDTYTVTSWHDGVKSIYVAVLDETDTGRMDLLHQEPSNEHTGIEIMVPVKPADIYTFRSTARWLFYYMQPRPMINVDLNEPDIQWEGKHGFWGSVVNEYGRSTNSWVAVMGCVPYKIELDPVIEDENGHTRGGPPLDDKTRGFLSRKSGALYFDIGDIQISASREEVEYTEKTLRAIKDKVRAFMAEMLKDNVGRITSAFESPWDRRKQAIFYESKTGLLLPGNYHDLAALQVPLQESGEAKFDTFTLNAIERNKKGGYRRLTPSGHVSMDAPFILVRDRRKTIRPYVTEFPMVAVPHDSDTPIEEIIAEIEDCLVDADLKGMPVKKMSDLQPVELPPEPEPSSGVVDNPKHQQRYFVLKDRLHFTTPYSKNWDIVEREPSDEDVFVILSRFDEKDPPHESHHWRWNRSPSEFYNFLRDTRDLWKRLGIDFPPVYGVKHTMKKPAHAEDTPGTPFRVWREEQLAEVVKTPKFRKLISALFWSQIFDRDYNVPRGKKNRQAVITFLREHLDGRHRLCRLMVRFDAAHDVITDMKGDELDLVKKMSEHSSKRAPIRIQPAEALERVYQRYPLLATHNGGPGFEVFHHSERRALWLDYINLVDRNRS